MRVIGIDPGRTTGITVLEEDLIIYHAVFNLYDLATRCEIREDLRELCWNEMPLYVEATGFRVNLKQKSPIYHAGAAVFGLDLEMCDLRFVLPSEWRAYIFDGGKLDTKTAKDAAVAYVKSKYDLETTHDGAESICIAEFGLWSRQGEVQ